MKNKYAKTPAIYQMEAAECGAASLAIIFAYYGKYIPLEKMRIETGVSRDGCSAGNIMQAGEKYGLKVRGYRQSMDMLLKTEVPCIIHWNFNHFVVFEGCRGKHCYINDPAVGRRKLTYEELDEAFTGIVLCFEKTKEFEKSKKKSTLFSFFKQRILGQYRMLATLFATGMLLAFPGLLIPLFSRIFIDEILLAGNLQWMSIFLFIMAFFMLFQGGLVIYRGLLLQRFRYKLSMSSAYQFFFHLLRLPVNFFEQRYAGDLGSRVENNHNISDFLTGELAETVLNIVVAIFYFILLLGYSPLLTLLGALGILANAVLLRCSAGKMENAAVKMQQDEGRLTGAMYAGIDVSSTLKASGMENGYIERVLGYYAKTIRHKQTLGSMQQIVITVTEVFQDISGILVLLFGGMLVFQEKMTPGSLTAFTILLSSFTAPVNRLAEFIQKIQMLKADMSRVEDIMNYRQDDKFAEHGKAASITGKLSGEIRLNNISFGYSPLEQPLIKGCSFQLECGKSLALVGTSGSGKSTVAKMVSGLYAPWEGQILMDGLLLETIPKEVVRFSVATVSQQVTLFSGSIRDNLTMWDRTIPEEDVIQAAKDACIHDIITKKAGAYEYRLTEGGNDFSGGQRQRLEIARALVSNPTILVMDEATSALDPLLEKEIIDNIGRRGCTCIIAAHRLSAIRDCDEIVVMEHGCIIQQGNHESLLAQEGLYQQLLTED